MGTPVISTDAESVKDVPIDTAIDYLETLERERRGLLKAGVVLRAPRSAKIDLSPRGWTGPFRRSHVR